MCLGRSHLAYTTEVHLENGRESANGVFKPQKSMPRLTLHIGDTLYLEKWVIILMFLGSLNLQ